MIFKYPYLNTNSFFDYFKKIILYIKIFFFYFKKLKLFFKIVLFVNLKNTFNIFKVRNNNKINV